MKVRFEVKLFLPFLLPRDSKRWGSEPIEYGVGDLKIGIVVLPQEKAAEAPKPPRNLVLTHSEDTGEFPKSQITSTPHMSFYDVLLVAVTGDLHDVADIYKLEVRSRYINTAIKSARRFFHYCRALAKDTEIFFDTPEVKPDNLSIDTFPHCEGWYDSQSGAPIGDNTVNKSYSEFVGARHGLSPVPWHRIRSAVRSEAEPPLHVLLILDARKALARYQDRVAVVLCAVAVEVAAKTYLQGSKLDKDILERLEKGLEQDFCNKYFDLLLRLAGAPSLKEEDATGFRALERLFRVRNKVAHEGIPYFEKDGHGTPVPLDHFEVSDLVATAEKAVDWLEVVPR
ncbi:MAG: hypothetical protein MUP80_14875 [Acidobacteriia bacterium]|nr:hypothetical protein [Terriglobia bacterium]